MLKFRYKESEKANVTHEIRNTGPCTFPLFQRKRERGEQQQQQ